MVYTSLPVYLDPPNWNQQQQQHQQQQLLPHQQPHQGGGSGGGAALTVAGDVGDLSQQHAPPRVDGGAMAGGIRPNSMAERARLAKIPQPEQALKCPRCDSTNTKFCYFNNYSLSQPRHFCKSCRRYWTRGGALRNVPVGGGCRRNKRSKSNGASKTSGAPDTKAGPSNPNSLAGASTSGSIATSCLQTLPQLPFLPSLHSLVDYGSTNIGLSYCTIPNIDPVEYPVVSSSNIGMEPWRVQQVHQLPFFAGMEPSTMPQPTSTSMGFYSFGMGGATGPMFTEAKPPHPHGVVSQPSSIKMEPHAQGINFERQFMGIPGNDQYWRGGGSGGSAGAVSETDGGSTGWTDLSGFNSTSTGVLL